MNPTIRSIITGTAANMKYLIQITIIVLFAMGIERRVHSAFIDNQLLHAIETHRADLVSRALASGADPNVATMSSSNIRYWNYFFSRRNDRDQSVSYLPIWQAAGSPGGYVGMPQTVSIIKALMAHGARISDGRNQPSLLLFAVAALSPIVVRTLIDGHPEILSDYRGPNLVIEALDRRVGSDLDVLEMINILSDANFNLNAADASGYSAYDHERLRKNRLSPQMHQKILHAIELAVVKQRGPLHLRAIRVEDPYSVRIQ